MNHFVYKLIPPRPTFDADMTEAESVVMGQHVSYWQGLLGAGRVVIFGPVNDPAGTWGLGIVEAETQDQVRAIGNDDPAVKSGVATFEVFPMPMAMVRS